MTLADSDGWGKRTTGTFLIIPKSFSAVEEIQGYSPANLVFRSARSCSNLGLSVWVMDVSQFSPLSLSPLWLHALHQGSHGQIHQYIDRTLVISVGFNRSRRIKHISVFFQDYHHLASSQGWPNKHGFASRPSSLTSDWSIVETRLAETDTNTIGVKLLSFVFVTSESDLDDMSATIPEIALSMPSLRKWTCH